MTVNRQAIDIGSWGLGIFAVSVGTTLTVQAQTRMSNPGWQLALSAASSDVWGAYLIICGLAMLGAILTQSWKTVGCFGIAVSMVLLARTVVAVLALQHPEASGTAPYFFLFTAGVYLLHGVTLLRRP